MRFKILIRRFFSVEVKLTQNRGPGTERKRRWSSSNDRRCNLIHYGWSSPSLSLSLALSLSLSLPLSLSIYLSHPLPLSLPPLPTLSVLSAFVSRVHAVKWEPKISHIIIRQKPRSTSLWSFRRLSNQWFFNSGSSQGGDRSCLETNLSHIFEFLIKKTWRR